MTMEDLNRTLMTAVANAKADTVCDLLKLGADPLHRDQMYNHQSALHKALEMQNTACAQIILDKLLENTPTEQRNLVIEAVCANISRKPFHAESVGVEHKLSDSSVERVQNAVAAIRRGEFVVVQDNEDRENEGDLIIAAEKVTGDKIAFMVNETSGLICCSTTAERLSELELPQMVVNNTEPHGTAFTVTVDYKYGTSTGISAFDRAATIKAIGTPSCTAGDFFRPGHILPLRACAGGVLDRAGHTEAAVDLARMAGLFPAGAICEIANKDGTMARSDALQLFIKKHNLLLVSITDIIKYRQMEEAQNRII